MVGLAATAVARLPVVSQARPELEQLSAADLGDGEPRDPRSVPRGLRRPGHAGADGGHGELGRTDAARCTRARAARRCSPSATPELARHCCAGGSSRSPNARSPTRTSCERALDEVRRRGYASSRASWKTGSITVAAPVLVDGKAVAAMSTSGPAIECPARDLPGSRAPRHGSGRSGRPSDVGRSSVIAHALVDPSPPGTLCFAVMAVYEYVCLAMRAPLRGAARDRRLGRGRARVPVVRRRPGARRFSVFATGRRLRRASHAPPRPPAADAAVAAAPAATETAQLTSV